jgi:TetR/AcrR family transcriptional repressor of nem operon
MARTKDFDEKDVLSKAVCLFWHKGYNATSMQDLVDHLGISRSSLYDTYGDKHTLYLRALDAYQQAGIKRIDDVITKAATAKEAITQLITLFTNEILHDEQQKGCFMVNAEIETAPHDTEVNELITKNEQAMEDAFYKVVSHGQKSGDITAKTDARALARFLMNTVKGIRVSVRSVKDQAYFDDIIDTSLQVLN